MIREPCPEPGPTERAFPGLPAGETAQGEGRAAALNPGLMTEEGAMTGAESGEFFQLAFVIYIWYSISFV
jgi:hypothetical protein